MAITHAQPLIPILLLVSLFLLPALGEFAMYWECDRRLYPITVTSVDTTPKETYFNITTVTITIMGESVWTARTAFNEVAITIRDLNSDYFSRLMDGICDVTQCPPEDGPIVITFPIFLNQGGVYAVQVEIKEKVPGKYTSRMCIVFEFQLDVESQTPTMDAYKKSLSSL